MKRGGRISILWRWVRILALGVVSGVSALWLQPNIWGFGIGLAGIVVWALLAWLERRLPQSPIVGTVGLIFDLYLVSVAIWLSRSVHAFWLLFVPSFYAVRTCGSGLAWLGAVATPLLVWMLASWSTEFTLTEATLWSWSLGLVGGHLALAWVAHRPEPVPPREAVDRMAHVLEQTENAHRELRHSYRELAHHYRQLQQTCETLQDTVDLFLALRQAMTPQEAYRTILERLRARFGVTGAALYLVDETGIHLRVAIGIGTLARLHGTVRLDESRKHTHQAVEQQVRQALAATLEHTSEQIASSHAVGTGTNPQVLTLPLRTPQRLVGLLTLVTQRSEGFDGATENRLHALLPHLLAVIHLYEQIEVMGLRLQEIQALHDLDNLLFTINLPEEIPRKALEVLQTVIPFEYAQFYTPCNGAFEVKAHWCLAQAVMEQLVFHGATGIEGWLQQKTALLNIPDTANSPYVPDPKAIAPMRSVLLVSLQSGTRIPGILLLGHSQAHFFTEARIELVQVLAIHLGQVLERAQLLTRLEQLAITDGLTGLYNYRYFQDRYREEVRLVKRYGHPLALILIDLDKFKYVNDRYGHPVGDQLLVQVAEVLQKTLRATELIARYGGDEFVVLMPSTGLRGARTAGERLLQAVSTTQFRVASGQPLLTITLSMGISAYPESTDNPEQLLELADLALENAKSAGRNRAEVIENTV